MSEKRFILCQDDLGNYEIRYDDKVFHFLWEVAPILNEQQDIINKRLDQIIELQDKYRILEFNHSRLEKRNKAQYEKIGEQQATINKLQKELASVCVQKSLICDELEILKKVMTNE